MDKRIEIADRFASMWRKSREEAGKSQEYMAKALGVSKKTIQNWEAGISSPTQAKGFEWFHVLGVQPLPYYLDLLYPDLMQKLADDPSEENITETLITAVSHLGSEQKKKLLYLFLGNHGSSVTGILELMTAHLQSPLRDRINIAQSVATNYQLAAQTCKIIRPEDIQPDIGLLNYTIQRGTEAVIHGAEGYSAMIDSEDVTI